MFLCSIGVKRGSWSEGWPNRRCSRPLRASAWWMWLSAISSGEGMYLCGQVDQSSSAGSRSKTHQRKRLSNWRVRRILKTTTAMAGGAL